MNSALKAKSNSQFSLVHKIQNTCIDIDINPSTTTTTTTTTTTDTDTAVIADTDTFGGQHE